MNDSDMKPSEIVELMDNTARELRFLHSEHERAKSELDVMRKKLEADERWQTHSNILRESIERIAELETGLRALAVDYFKQTGVKSAHEAASVRLVDEAVYDQAEAASWAWENLREAFKFDAKAFEKYAKGVREVKPLPFVKFEKKMQPMISRKLLSDISDESGLENTGE
jgi:hypothetical protein